MLRIFPAWVGWADRLAAHEEWYAPKNFAPDLHVLLAQRTRDLAGGCYRRPPYPVTWARMHGRGRVFYTSLGHCETTWSHPDFQQIVLAGLAWILRRFDADIAPNIRQVTPYADQWPREHRFAHLLVPAGTA